MKRLVFWQLFVAALLLTSNSHAQSIKDLFNKEKYREGGKCRDRQVNSGYDRHLVVYRLRH